MRAAWGRIDAWLRKWGPDSYARLAPPAEPGAVAAAEAALHMRFPAELRASLGCHDGAGGEGVLPVKPPLSAAGIVRYWTRWMELTEEEREFGDPEEEGNRPGTPGGFRGRRVTVTPRSSTGGTGRGSGGSA